jgi:hypothetical protein
MALGPLVFVRVNLDDVQYTVVDFDSLVFLHESCTFPVFGSKTSLVQPSFL